MITKLSFHSRIVFWGSLIILVIISQLSFGIVMADSSDSVILGTEDDSPTITITSVSTGLDEIGDWEYKVLYGDQPLAVCKAPPTRHVFGGGHIAAVWELGWREGRQYAKTLGDAGKVLCFRGEFSDSRLGRRSYHYKGVYLDPLKTSELSSESQEGDSAISVDHDTITIETKFRGVGVIGVFPTPIINSDTWVRRLIPRTTTCDGFVFLKYTRTNPLQGSPAVWRHAWTDYSGSSYTIPKSEYNKNIRICFAGQYLNKEDKWHFKHHDEFYRRDPASTSRPYEFYRDPDSNPQPSSSGDSSNRNVDPTVDSTCEDINNNCQALETLNSILNYMAIIIFPITIIMIIVGGIQYSIARDNPEAVASARSRIYKAVLALILLISLWTFLQWLIPGGILGG
ncbi:MAG: hypothetical protein OXF85_01865 [Candidatus Saccharibacteria bacterium]|nr:hypothetical protein [Candidatus Saccharibacteria bacterium]